MTEAVDGSESPISMKIPVARSESMIDFGAMDSPEHEKKLSTKALWKKAFDNRFELLKRFDVPLYSYKLSHHFTYYFMIICASVSNVGT